MQRGREVRIAMHEVRKVRRHLVEDGAVAMRLVDALANVGEEPRVVDRVTLLLHRIDERGVRRDLRERIERVDPVVTRRRRTELLRVVERLQLLFRELAEAVVALVDVLVAVHLQHVPEALVDEQAAHRELRRHRHRLDEVRVAAVDQLRDRRTNGEVVHRRLVVDRQRVVHVEADPADAAHLQIAVAEDAVRTRDAVALAM